jgi:hypothetical protein
MEILIYQSLIIPSSCEMHSLINLELLAVYYFALEPIWVEGILR